jgi:hypothetical protein
MKSLLRVHVLCGALSVAILLGATTVYAQPAAEGPMIDAAQRLSSRFDTFAFVPDDPRGRVAYGTANGNIYMLEYDDGYYRTIWTGPSMVTRVSHVLIADITGNGQYEMVACNTRGYLKIWSTRDFGIVWESPETQFESIEALTVAQVDNDPQLELIFSSRGKLYIYDGKHFIEEWRSNQIFDATDIVVGEVDGDGEPEIILNTGYVLNGYTQDIEWESFEPFGEMLELVDIDGDRKLELISGTPGASKIWDLDQRREKWE